MEELKLDKALADHIDEHIKDCEKEMDDDAESIITNQRYSYINGVVDKAVKKKARVDHLTVSDKIDQIVTNRILALPIFALVMFLMYSLSMAPPLQMAAGPSAPLPPTGPTMSCLVRSCRARWAASWRASVWQAGCTA